tara:strand:- start:216 stop:395 length:180 start_codon:yes stop_codon:yes gene_type:complete
MELPPSDGGTSQLTIAPWLSVDVAVTFTGTEGIVAGITLPVVTDDGLVPTLLVAVNVNE